MKPSMKLPKISLTLIKYFFVTIGYKYMLFPNTNEKKISVCDQKAYYQFIIKNLSLDKKK